MTASFHCGGTFPSLQMRVVSRWSSSRMVRSCSSPSFSSSAGRPSRPTAFAFAIAFIAVAISSSVGSIPTALATGCCGSLFRMSISSMLDFAFSSERKNRTHLSRIRPLSYISLPSSSPMHCDATFFVSFSCADLMFWKNPCWSPTRNCFSNSTTWRSNKRTIAALRTFFSQLHAFLTALRSCAPLVSIFRRCHAACIASVAACSSASVRASPLQPCPGLLRSWGGITNSAVRMMAAMNAASTSFTLLSPVGFALSCFPTAVATSCRSWGSVTRRLRSAGGLAGAFNPRLRAKWPRSLMGADTMLWSEMGRKEGWRCTVTFRTSLRSRCLVRI